MSGDRKVVMRAQVDRQVTPQVLGYRQVESSRAGTIAFKMWKLVQWGASEGQGDRLTLQESMRLARFREAQARGEALVHDYPRARNAMVAAVNEGPAIQELHALERQAMELGAKALRR